jgi:hypothetical protein
MTMKHTNWLSNRPNAHKIYQHLPLQHPPKIIQIWIFVLKIYHMATLQLPTKTIGTLHMNIIATNVKQMSVLYLCFCEEWAFC